ncbi:hypothetical protein B0A48_07223 [Cryoendolithus antarcticus]|uniref:Uncharacterized protein n=1 Tax=Cryoendolithus antarcticus TaxID=1507870 RepID=A0A1V8T7Y1_9PEZI|nr:hypothetical protein B0A48_07223 [Cryoendolithus antarcticus]
MCFALRHDIWASPDSEALLSNNAQHSGIYDIKGADPASSTTTDDERLPKLTSPSDKPNIGVESEDTERAVQEVMHGECMDVVLYVPSWRDDRTETFLQNCVSTTPGQDSGKEISGPDSGAMDLDSSEPISQGSMTVEVDDEVTTSSDDEVLQPAIQTELHLVGALLDGAKDGAMSVQSSSEEALIRPMMRSGVEVIAVDDNVTVVTTGASAVQPLPDRQLPVTTASTTLSPVQDVSEVTSTPEDVDAMLTVTEGSAIPVMPEASSSGQALALPVDPLPVDQIPDMINVMDGIIGLDADIERIAEIASTTDSNPVPSPIDLCSPESNVFPMQTPPTDIRPTSTVVDSVEKMDFDGEAPVILEHVAEKTMPRTAIAKAAARNGTKPVETKASRTAASMSSTATILDTPGAASLKRKAPDTVAGNPPAKKLKSATPTASTKATTSTAAKKGGSRGTAKMAARILASKSPSEVPEVVMIDSGPSTPASQIATPPPKPIASNSKHPASGRSGKPVGTPSATKNGVEKTSIAATDPKPKATVADTKKPTARKNDKITVTPSVARDDAVQVSVVAKPKSKTATATAKEATRSQTASKTATPSVAEDDEFEDEDEDEDEDDEPSSETGNKDIQTPAKPVCSRCKVLMRKELKGAHDKAIKALKKAHESALEAQKKKSNQNIADQKASLEKKAKTAADSHEKAIEKLKARLEKVEEAHKDKVEDLKNKHETKVESLTAERDDAVNKRREVEKAAATALRQHKEAMAKKDAKLKEDTQKIKDAKRTEIDEMKPELNAAMRDKMREIRELTVSKEKLEKALSESTADAEAQSKAAEKWQMDYTASERRKLRAKKRVEELEGELDAIRKSGLGPNPNVSAMRDDYEDELREMRGRVDRARRNEAESGHRVVTEQRALFSMRAANERHKVKANKAEEKAAKAELENKVLREMLARLSGKGGGRADVEMSG